MPFQPRYRWFAESLLERQESSGVSAPGNTTAAITAGRRSHCHHEERRESCSRTRSKRLEITADRVLQEIAKLAFYDPRDLPESDGSMKQIKDIDPITRMAIAGLEVTELFEGTGDERHAYGLCKQIRA